MNIGKYLIEDFERVLTAAKKSRRAVAFLIGFDGPTIKFLFEDDQGKQCIIEVYDMEDSKRKPTITRTEPL